MLDRPLRPLWATPASGRFPYVAPDASFLPVICVSASCAIDAVDGRDSGDVGLGRRAGGFSYVQGSGDDHELWGQVRAPPLSLLFLTDKFSDHIYHTLGTCHCTL
jgi:tRNA A64-2'-O-ribosylphosphate transferase